jgi:hypothetical protein
MTGAPSMRRIRGSWKNIMTFKNELHEMPMVVILNFNFKSCLERLYKVNMSYKVRCRRSYAEVSKLNLAIKASD